MADNSQTTFIDLLQTARESAQRGERDKAYQVSLQATSLAPNEAQAWYLRAQTAPSTEERLMCLSRAYSLDPTDPEARQELRGAVKGLLKQEPFLAYVYETEQFYQVRSGRDLLVNVPKNRAYERPYLQKLPQLSKPAFRWLYFALGALLLGGLGAIVLAPISAFQALRLLLKASTHEDRIRLWMVLFLSVTIWIVALPISWLLLIRLLPQ